MGLIRRAYLLVNPDRPCLKPLLGLPPVIRTAGALTRSGVAEVIVCGPQDAGLVSLFASHGYSNVRFQSAMPRAEDGLLLPADFHFDPELIERLARGEFAGLKEALAEAPSDLWHPLDGGEASLKVAERKLFQVIRRKTEGWVAPRINKPVSFWLTRRLVRYPVTPNQITAVNLAIALAGAFLVASLDYPLRVLGAALLYLSSIVDGCDGEVARLKLKGSKFGAWFDTVADDLSNNAFVAAIFVGLFRSSGDWLYLKAGSLALLLSLGVTAVIYHQLLTSVTTGNAKDFNPAWQASPSKTSWFERLRPLLKRDFFIAVLFAAVVLDVRPAAFWLSAASALAAFSLYAVSFAMSVFAARSRPRHSHSQ